MLESRDLDAVLCAKDWLLMIFGGYNLLVLLMIFLKLAG